MGHKVFCCFVNLEGVQHFHVFNIVREANYCIEYTVLSLSLLIVKSDIISRLISHLVTDTNENGRVNI